MSDLFSFSYWKNSCKLCALCFQTNFDRNHTQKNLLMWNDRSKLTEWLRVMCHKQQPREALLFRGECGCASAIVFVCFAYSYEYRTMTANDNERVCSYMNMHAVCCVHVFDSVPWVCTQNTNTSYDAVVNERTHTLSPPVTLKRKRLIVVALPEWRDTRYAGIGVPTLKLYQH